MSGARSRSFRTRPGRARISPTPTALHPHSSVPGGRGDEGTPNFSGYRAGSSLPRARRLSTWRRASGCATWDRSSQERRRSTGADRLMHDQGMSQSSFDSPGGGRRVTSAAARGSGSPVQCAPATAESNRHPRRLLVARKLLFVTGTRADFGKLRPPCGGREGRGLPDRLLRHRHAHAGTVRPHEDRGAPRRRRPRYSNTSTSSRTTASTPFSQRRLPAARTFSPSTGPISSSSTATGSKPWHAPSRARRTTFAPRTWRGVRYRGRSTRSFATATQSSRPFTS